MTPVILIVEDNDDLRDLVTEIIAAMGYTPLGAPDGEAAMHLIASENRIDLLFTDIGMPGRLNGFALARAAKAIRPALKVLYATGYSSLLHEGREGETFGPVLAKPFRPRHLVEEIQRALGSCL
jgi:CheY-like chemotaxis protein